jgi:hypothetical protein
MPCISKAYGTFVKLGVFVSLRKPVRVWVTKSSTAP